MASNVFVTLTPPVGNGSGAAVDVSSMGATKTIAVGSSGGVYEPITTVEVSQDGISFAPIASFQGRKEVTIAVACKYMRETISNFKDGSIPTVGVGADDTDSSQTSLAVPAGSTEGAASVTSSLRQIKTVQVGGDFRGTVNIQISDDGGVTYTTVMSFNLPGVQTAMFTADHMRVSRSGVPQVSPGLPTVIVADAGPAGGGGSGGLFQAFSYTVNGLEADASSLPITLPVAYLTPTYKAAMALVDTLYAMGAVITNKTPAGFTLALTFNATVGDTFDFITSDKTN